MQFEGLNIQVGLVTKYIYLKFSLEPNLDLVLEVRL